MRTLLLTVLITASATAISVGEVSAPETCVGEICLDKSPPDETKLIESYGDGFVGGILKSEGRYLEKSHCYYIHERNIWIEFTADYHDQTLEKKEIVSIFLSRESLCSKSYVPKKVFKRFETPRGIQIGSAEKEVIRAYGQPIRIDNSVEREQKDPGYKNTRLASKYGSKVLVYSAVGKNRLRASFYIKDGRVYSLEISASE